MAVADPTYVKVPSLFIHAPGLFRSLQKGERTKLKLDITYDVALSTFHFSGPEPLDSTDLRVLQGIRQTPRRACGKLSS